MRSTVQSEIFNDIVVLPLWKKKKKNRRASESFVQDLNDKITVMTYCSQQINLFNLRCNSVTRKYKQTNI